LTVRILGISASIASFPHHAARYCLDPRLKLDYKDSFELD
jgi:hypothetical protein